MLVIQDLKEVEVLGILNAVSIINFPIIFKSMASMIYIPAQMIALLANAGKIIVFLSIVAMTNVEKSLLR